MRPFRTQAGAPTTDHDAHATAMPADMRLLKARIRATWMSGDYRHFATYLEPGALEFLKRLSIAPRSRVLDVGCGAGQITIPAARAGARVTGVDIASNLIVQARARASLEGVKVQFDEGDAESLPYADASFDLVVSLVGVMFAPRPAQVAAELKRVCRPGGRIVLANWTAQGHVGQMFQVLGKYVPPSPLMPPPVKWGDIDTAHTLLKHGTSNFFATKRTYSMWYPFPAAEVVEFFREYFGPVNRAFAALDAVPQQRLRRELEALWSRNNRAREGLTHVDAEYLEVTAFREQSPRSAA